MCSVLCALCSVLCALCSGGGGGGGGDKPNVGKRVFLRQFEICGVVIPNVNHYPITPPPPPIDVNSHMNWDLGV